MTNLVCWAVPARAGYVLRADGSTRQVTAAAAARPPRFWGWRITVLHPGDHRLVAELARRPVTLAIDYVRRQGSLPAVNDDGRLIRIIDLTRRHWNSIGLGAVLVILSGGHWVPALAGVWLIAARRWLIDLLGLGERTTAPVYAPQKPVEVRAECHAGLAAMARLIATARDDRAGYAAAESAARAIDLTDVAEVYGELARATSPAAVHSDTGWWVASSDLHQLSRKHMATDGLASTVPGTTGVPGHGGRMLGPHEEPL